VKRIFGFALMCALLSVAALAASNSQTINFSGAVQVGTTTLPAGEYKVSWTGTGDSGKVTFEKKGIAPVTVSAKIVDEKNGHTGISTDTQGGKDVLKTIVFSKVSLIL